MRHYIQNLILASVLVMSTSSCITNTILKDGKPIAILQGNFKDFKLESKANGDTILTATEIDNSTPARVYSETIGAYGAATTKIITATALAPAIGTYINKQ